jgi:hypothetical protein
MTHLRRTALALAALLASGCYYEQDLAWEVEVPDELEPDVETILTRIRVDGCGDGDRIEYEYRLRPPGEVTDQPHELSDGRFCFQAVAFDADCALVATSDVAVELPLDEGVEPQVVNVLAREEPSVPCLGTCVGGVCEVCTDDDVYCDGPPRCCPWSPIDPCDPEEAAECDLL